MILTLVKPVAICVRFANLFGAFFDLINSCLNRKRKRNVSDVFVTGTDEFPWSLGARNAFDDLRDVRNT